MNDTLLQSVTKNLETLADALLVLHWTCATAESCTGGLVGATLTGVPGASRWFDGGVISYANAVKLHVLGVTATNLDRYGAVSHPVARQMALGACKATGADMAISLTGIAGPDGGSDDKPVGTVYIGLAVHDSVWSFRHRFYGNRDEIRRQAAAAAIVRLLQGASCHLQAQKCHLLFPTDRL